MKIILTNREGQPIVALNLFQAAIFFVLEFILNTIMAIGYALGFLFGICEMIWEQCRGEKKSK